LNSKAAVLLYLIWGIRVELETCLLLVECRLSRLAIARVEKVRDAMAERLEGGRLVDWINASPLFNETNEIQSDFKVISAR
jgi:hypothetical protein